MPIPINPGAIQSLNLESVPCKEQLATRHFLQVGQQRRLLHRCSCVILKSIKYRQFRKYSVNINCLEQREYSVHYLAKTVISAVCVIIPERNQNESFSLWNSFIDGNWNCLTRRQPASYPEFQPPNCGPSIYSLYPIHPVLSVGQSQSLSQLPLGDWTG